MPCQTGQLRITGIKYSLTSVAINGPVDEKFSIASVPNSAMTAVSILGRLDLVVKGQRLNNTKAEKTSVVHAQDNRLKLEVVSAMPLLEVCTVSRAIHVSKSQILQMVSGKFDIKRRHGAENSISTILPSSPSS